MQMENLGALREQAVLHAVCGEGRQGSAARGLLLCALCHHVLCCMPGCAVARRRVA